jgi:DNA helicase-2/ATP-dependent DNA helicase PcrA
MIDEGLCSVEPQGPLQGPPDAAHGGGWRFVALDEMHDTTRAMIAVLRGVLAANPDAVFLGVGDVDQTIHEEAGADAEAMGAGFDREIGPAERLPLDASYRFGATLADMLARHAGKLYRSKASRSTVVDVRAVDTALDQALFVERALAERIGLSDRAKHGELAVLLRHPARAVMLENRLIDRGVAFEAVGFTPYLMRPEVLFVRGVLVAALDAPHLVENKAVHRALVEAMLFFAGAAAGSTVGTVMESGADVGGIADRGRDADGGAAISPAQVARADSLPAFVRGPVLDLAGQRVASALRDALSLAARGRTQDFPALLQRLDIPAMAERVLVRREDVLAVRDTMQGLARAVADSDSLEAFLRTSNEREVRVAAMRRMDRVKLSTIEAAKGLEFDHVVVPDVNTGDFDGDHGDERNLFYVAASRARLRLTLMHATGRASSYLAFTSNAG